MYKRTYTQIGTVYYVFNQKASRYILKVKPDLSVWVTIPKLGSLEKAEEFLLSKSDWILKTLKKNEAKITTPKSFEDGEYISHFHKLQFKKGKVLQAFVKRNIVTVFCPSELEFNSKEVTEFISLALEHVYKIEAKDYIPNRLSELAAEFDFKYVSVKINSAKTRWGSCSGTNNINISKFIMKLPFELIDLVLLHELSHTVQKNHSKDFYALLESCLPGKRKGLERQLKNYSIV